MAKRSPISGLNVFDPGGMVESGIGQDPGEVNPFDPLNGGKATAKTFGKDSFNFYDPGDAGEQSGISPGTIRTIGTILAALYANPYIGAGANAAAGSMEGGIEGANNSLLSSAATAGLGAVGAGSLAGAPATPDLAPFGTGMTGAGALVAPATGLDPGLDSMLATFGTGVTGALPVASAGPGGGFGALTPSVTDKLSGKAGDVLKALTQSGGPSMSAPNAPASISTTPTPSGPASAGPSGLPISNSTAPDIYPWRTSGKAKL